MRTHEEYINEVYEINPNIQVLGEYKKVKLKVLHKCLIHNIEWEALPSNILRGRGCPQCKLDKISNKKRKTHKQYCEDLLKLNPNIIPLEEYKIGKVPIKHLCKIHNIEFECSPNYVLKGTGCPKCTKENRHKSKSMGHEKYLSFLKENNPRIIPLEEYYDINTPIMHLCSIHNEKWKTSPICVINGGGCPLCHKERIAKSNTKTHQQYLNKLIEKGIDVEVLETYKGAKINIAHLCKIHNVIWYPMPCNVLSGKSLGCYKCNNSVGETLITKWLDNHNISYIAQYRFNDCKDKNTLPFDFYLIDLNKCIEYDGIQHYESRDFFGGDESFKILQLHDKIKTEYCEQNNIPLLRIPYYEKDIEAQLEQFIFN